MGAAAKVDIVRVYIYIELRCVICWGEVEYSFAKTIESNCDIQKIDV